VHGGSREDDLEGQLSALRQALTDSGNKSQELAAANQTPQTDLEAAELAQRSAEDRLDPLQQRLVAEAVRANNLGVTPTPLAFRNWQPGHYQLIIFDLGLCKCQFNDPPEFSTEDLQRGYYAIPGMFMVNFEGHAFPEKYDENALTGSEWTSTPQRPQTC
jgi:hypothetical protein